MIVTFSVLSDVSYSTHGLGRQQPHASLLPRLPASGAWVCEADDRSLQQRPRAIRGVSGKAEAEFNRSPARGRARLHPGIIFEPTRRPLGGKEAFRHPAPLPALAARWKNRQGSDPEHRLAEAMEAAAQAAKPPRS